MILFILGGFLSIMVTKILGNKVKTFKEKSKLDEGWINGGFFVVEPKFLNFIKDDSTFLEREPLERASKNNQLLAFKHNGFWQCMDTKRDRETLEQMWNNDPMWAVDKNRQKVS